MAVLLVPALVLFGICLANALSWIGQPFSGFLFLENGVAVSIGRSQWWVDPRYRSLPFARVIAVDGRRVSDGRDIHQYVRGTGVGRPITYTLRKDTDIVDIQLPVRRFSSMDFCELFAPLLGAGLLMILVSAGVVVRRPDTFEARALFALSLIIGLTLMTGPDEYSPYWFTRLFFVSLCAVPPASLQNLLTNLGLRRPRWRRRPLAYVALYVPFVALGTALHAAMPEPSAFLPLLYAVYLLVAYAGLLYVGGLIMPLVEGVWPRRAIFLGAAAVAGGAVVHVAIRVTYPVLLRPISPTWLAVPLLVVPVVMSAAFWNYPRSLDAMGSR